MGTKKVSPSTKKFLKQLMKAMEIIRLENRLIAIEKERKKVLKALEKKA